MCTLANFIIDCYLSDIIDERLTILYNYTSFSKLISGLMNKINKDN